MPDHRPEGEHDLTHPGKIVACFLTELCWEFAEDERTGKLLEPLVFSSDRYGIIKVPRQFSTDLASIPRLFWNVFPPFGPYGRAAVIHDFLYRTQPLVRVNCDSVLLEGMTCCRVDWMTRQTIYRAVRVFGGIAWLENQQRPDFQRSKPGAF